VGGAAHDESVRVCFSAARWNCDLLSTAQEATGLTSLFPQYYVEGPSGNDFTAFYAGARAKVDQVIGRTHRVLVVFDDDHRVTHITKLV
jgi:hypothetical protein